MCKYLTKPCRDNLVGLERKILKHEDLTREDRTLDTLLDCILYVLYEAERLDLEGVNRD